MHGPLRPYRALVAGTNEIESVGRRLLVLAKMLMKEGRLSFMLALHTEVGIFTAARTPKNHRRATCFSVNNHTAAA